MRELELFLRYAPADFRRTEPRGRPMGHIVTDLKTGEIRFEEHPPEPREPESS